MRELAVHRYGHDLHVHRLEFRHAVRIGEDFGGADEGEIERIEENEAVRALEMRLQIEIFDNLTVGKDSGCGEIGGGFTDEYAHKLAPELGF